MTQLVCDDHPLVRSALALVVEEIAGGPVLARGDFAEAWEAAEQHPDLSLCVVDLHMPGMRAVEGLSGLKARAPGAKIVVVTGSDRDEDLLAALALGVDGFVPKSAEPGVVEASLRLVLAGGRYIPERVAELARSGVRPPSLEGGSIPEAGAGLLSRRQRDVLDQLARGRSNKEIARLLGLSPATIKTHVEHIFSVLGASNRTEAVALAREKALL